MTTLRIFVLAELAAPLVLFCVKLTQNLNLAPLVLTVAALIARAAA